MQPMERAQWGEATVGSWGSRRLGMGRHLCECGLMGQRPRQRCSGVIGGPRVMMRILPHFSNAQVGSLPSSQRHVGSSGSVLKRQATPRTCSQPGMRLRSV